MDAYEGLRLGFRIRLQQEGNRVTGIGRKISENGKVIPAIRQTPIEVQGIREGERLTLAFTELGRRRASGGQLDLVEENLRLWRGRFASDAARSTGSAEARRE